MNAWHGFDVVPAAMPYYERADLMSAISYLRVKIEEWSYDADPHYYCHERPDLILVVLAAQAWQEDSINPAPKGPPMKIGDMNVEDRHPATQHFAPLFAHEHLREGLLRDTSMACATLAATLVDVLPDGPELTAGLRKLLEAKDCFVRAALHGSR